ncbi:17653_t:CDS:2 [Funneliformis caledonium]|uniref:17653_t:CDS:1 n=1 Tax=Funneliformis caledonium TaxID=1117310 RepID=A0A9N8V8K7_9GLOM|nr:17653_t:CDS:2 [Funneliformis caledonium]
MVNCPYCTNTLNCLCGPLPYLCETSHSTNLDEQSDSRIFRRKTFNSGITRLSIIYDLTVEQDRTSDECSKMKIKSSRLALYVRSPAKDDRSLIM